MLKYECWSFADRVLEQGSQQLRCRCLRWRVICNAGIVLDSKIANSPRVNHTSLEGGLDDHRCVGVVTLLSTYGTAVQAAICCLLVVEDNSVPEVYHPVLAHSGALLFTT